MDHLSVRLGLERLLRSPLPDATWDYLVSRGEVQRVAEGTAELGDLANEVHRLFNAFNAPLPTRSEFGEASMLGEALVSERERALSILMVQEANRETVVTRFREEALGGKLIQSGQVERWILERAEEGWAAQRDLGIPELPPQLARFVGPEVLRYARPGFPYSLGVDVPKVGVLRDLVGVSVVLAHRFPWSEAQATMFVLTGETPQVLLLKSEVNLGGLPASCRITITIDPTVSPPELMDYYRQVRAQVLDGRYRSLTEKHTRLAVFPLEHPEGTPWQGLFEAWNEEIADEHPDWAYTEMEQFARDCREARKNLLNPPVRTAFEGQVG